MKKTAELRKRVLQRQERNKEKSDSVSFQVFILLAIFYHTITLLVSYLDLVQKWFCKMDLHQFVQ